jgi:hypothetical protein
MKTIERPGSWTLLALVAMLVIAVGPAAAGEAPTREKYVAQLEGLCKPDAEATERAMKGARSDVKAERIAIAAGKFDRATTIFTGTVDLISKVPRPTADAARLTKWFGYLQTQESFMRQIAAELRAEHVIQAQRLTARFIHNGNLANRVVLAFGFDYCSFKFSRYG